MIYEQNSLQDNFRVFAPVMILGSGAGRIKLDCGATPDCQPPLVTALYSSTTFLHAPGKAMVISIEIHSLATMTLSPVARSYHLIREFH